MKKWMLIILMSLITFTTISLGTACAAGSNNPLKSMESYKVYYSAPTKSILKKLTQYDVVIIEPTLYTKEQIQSIQSAGTKVLGYISVMETPTWNLERVQALQESDYFIRNGMKVHYIKWDSYLMDITSNHYQTVLLSEIQKQVVEKGLDGVFYDTVGDIDDEFLNSDKKTYNNQLQGLLQFVKQAKFNYPNLLMVQNWGMETIKHTATYMDGYMWEGFNYQKVIKDSWSQAQIQSLQKLQLTNNLQVMTISTLTEVKSKEYAKKFGFLHYHARTSYDQF
jgi:polysaccharide biosynthesis protein PelA